MQFKIWLLESEHMGDFVHKKQGIWMIPFQNIKHDAKDGWYVHWDYGDVSDLAKMQPGDKVGDRNLHTAITGTDKHAMWTINYIDEDKGKIFLTPTDNNPWLSGVGAGGAKFGKHDLEVHTGEYETRRINDILSALKSGSVRDVRDMAYVLLGTVQTHVGPNGSQGGWYSSTDINSNRGGKNGMDSKEIMMRDAHTIVSQFKLNVPKQALTGEMEPRHWDQFMGGSDEPYGEIEGENFSDPKTMAQIVLSHPQPQIKLRNVTALLNIFRGVKQKRSTIDAIHQKYRSTLNDPNYDNELSAAYDKDFSEKSVLPIVKELAEKMATNQLNAYTDPYSSVAVDPYWLTKEKLIYVARDQNWTQILKLYEDTIDGDNRRLVYDFYSEQKNKSGMKRMLIKEINPQTLTNMLWKASEIIPDELNTYIVNNVKKIKTIYSSASSYYKEELKKALVVYGTRVGVKHDNYVMQQALIEITRD